MSPNQILKIVAKSHKECSFFNRVNCEKAHKFYNTGCPTIDIVFRDHIYLG